MNRTSGSRPKNLKGTLKHLFNYLKHHIYLLILISILVLIPAIATMIGTYSIKYIIDYAEEKNLEAIKHLCIKIGILYACGALSCYTYMHLLAYLAQQITYELRRDLFKKMVSLPIGYIDTHSYGNIMSLFTNDMDTVTDALNNAFATLIQYAVEIVGMIVCIFILSYQLSFIVVGFYILMFSYIIYSSKKSKSFYKKQQKELGKLNGFADEIIRGQRTVKVFNHEEASKEEFNKLSRTLADSSKKAMTYALSMVPMVMFLSYVNYGIVTIVGGVMVINGVIDTIGTLSSYLVFVRQTAMPINRFTGQANLLLNALAGAERIFALLDEPSEFDCGTVTLVHAKEENGSLVISNLNSDPYAWNDNGSLTPLKGDVRFNNVVFEYNPNKKILHGISLYAKPGQKIAFVGSTGAGKTTIVSLINRFYEVTEGTITFDSIDIKRIKKSELRKAIGNVLQDTHLFVGTIEDNIKFGKLDATHEEVVRAAKLAHADSFISRLPDGYNTLLTTDGLNLSQGQRQLLAIARAAIANPPVLVLDEATSSIDTYTEHLIQEGMDELMKGRTVFVIAHRLSTVMNSNAIIVLEMGNIIERGEHQELLEQKGRYYSLYTGKSELQ